MEDLDCGGAILDRTARTGARFGTKHRTGHARLDTSYPHACTLRPRAATVTGCRGASLPICANDGPVYAVRLATCELRAGSTSRRRAYAEGAPISRLSSPTRKIADSTLGLRSASGRSARCLSVRSSWK